MGMWTWGCQESPWEQRTSTRGWTLSFLRTTMMFCSNSNEKKGGAVRGNMFLPVPSLLLSTMSFLAMVRLKSLCFGQFCGNRVITLVCLLHFPLTILFRLCRWWLFDNPFNSHLVLYSVNFLCVSSIYETDLPNFGFKSAIVREVNCIFTNEFNFFQKIIKDHL